MHPAVRERSQLADLDREYTLGEIAIITRAGPARILGLTHKGHLGPGADADITIYTPHENKETMFELPRYVIKSGRVLVEEGEIREEFYGKTLHVAPEYDQGRSRRYQRLVRTVLLDPLSQLPRRGRLPARRGSRRQRRAVDVIAIRNLAIRHGALFAARHVSLEVQAQQHAVLMGKTGSGKTTLLECHLWSADTPLRNHHAGPPRCYQAAARRPRDRLRASGCALFPSMTSAGTSGVSPAVATLAKNSCCAAGRALGAVLGNRVDLTTGGRRDSAAASGNVWPWDERYRLSPMCCCWTNRSAPWTTTRGSKSISCCGMSAKKQMRPYLHITHNRLDALELADRRFVLQDSEITEDDIQ